MRLRRLRVPSLTSEELALVSAQAHYVRDVLRLGAGAVIELFDGRGNAAKATLVQVDASAVRLRVDGRYAGEAAAAITIAMATPKGERADWAVEKLTELGVTRLVWLVCERSVAVPRDDGKKLARWERLAEAAAGQSGRNDVPVIEAPVPFTEAVAELGGGAIAHMGGLPLAKLVAARPEMPLVCLIGPEGGFTRGELEMAEAAGYSRVGLARHVLRSETAAMAAAVALSNADREHP
jgi:16S rRNA (uracil1498-N3)-methyltransferase